MGKDVGRNRDIMSVSLSSWSPFQSAEVRQICAHMTPAELASVRRRGGLYGLWVAATFAIPLSMAITWPSPVALTVASVLILLHVICIPIWMRRQRRFLASTSWATSQGIKSESLRLFSLRG